MCPRKTDCTGTSHLNEFAVSQLTRQRYPRVEKSTAIEVSCSMLICDSTVSELASGGKNLYFCFFELQPVESQESNMRERFSGFANEKRELHSIITYHKCLQTATLMTRKTFSRFTCTHDLKL